MKRLYLLRHADALSTGQDDKSRILSDLGKKQAQALGDLFKERDYKADIVACSPAFRTKETLDLVYPDHDADLPENFYNGSPTDLFDYIQKIDNQKKSALIVNHNPTIHKLVFMLTGDGREEDVQTLTMGYRPCTLSVFDCPISNWADLALRENTLVEIIPPQH